MLKDRKRGKKITQTSLRKEAGHEYADKASTIRLPSDPLSDSWTADSGATSCMTMRDGWLRNAIPERSDTSRSFDHPGSNAAL